MRALLFVTVVILLAFPEAYAAEATFTATWDAPTQRNNGEALPADQIKGYQLEATIEQNGAEVRSVTHDVPAGETRFSDTFEVPEYGEVVGTYRVKTIDVYGLSSVWSDPATATKKVVPGSAPGAPANLTIETPGTAAGG